MAECQKIGSSRVVRGQLERWQHPAVTLGGLPAKFHIFLPSCHHGSSSGPMGGPIPYILYLSGLTCTDENAPNKATNFHKASELGIALVFPDTSPRGANIEGENDEYDVGTGAGFYINAVKDPWSKYYKMEDYIMKELIPLVETKFRLDPRRKAIMGHSMGGHGALTLALKYPRVFTSVSCFAPCCAPSRVAWGEKVFTAYLGNDVEAWKKHDAVELLKTYSGPDLNLLVDQGLEDEFLHNPNLLQPQKLEEVCSARNLSLTYRPQAGYDHSYYFISTFFDEHLVHHYQFLRSEEKKQ